MKAQHSFITLDSRQLLLTGFGLEQQSRECTVIVPPFAEELNKCRRMMALQAAALARAGRACCYLDLSGTGDSEGSFGSARWEHWIAELQALLETLQRTHAIERFDLVGVRLGFLLALEVAALNESPVSRIIGWQPVTNGASHAKQFLRMRVMAEKLGETSAPVSVKALRKQLAADGVLEVAGYLLSEPLIAAIEGCTLEDALARTGQAVAWFEVQAQPEAKLSPASQRAIASIPEGRLAAAAAVSGEPFWSTVEIGYAPALIDRTIAQLTAA